MKFTLLAIIDWEKNYAQIAGDMSHEGDAPVEGLVAKEMEKKVENNNWPGLPFTCTANNLDEALDIYNAKCCEFDYIRAINADYNVSNK